MRRWWRAPARPAEDRAWVRRGAWAAAPALLAGLAVWHPGAPVAQVELHDGTVWVTNEAELRLGRFNPVVEELNAGLAATADRFDVLQDGFDVLLAQAGSLAVVDPAQVALAGQATTPFGARVSMAGGTTAVVGPDGAVWARPTALVGSLRADADPPDLELGEGGAAVVARGGTVLAVGPDGAVHRLTATADGTAVAEAGRLAGGVAGPVHQVTAVGDEVVVLSGRTLATRTGVVDLSGHQGALALQQPGPPADAVLVGVRGGLLEVPLDGGEPTLLPAGGGEPTAPVRVAGCAHGAWAAPSDNYVRACRGEAPVTESLTEVASADRLVFRVNRDVVVLNDVANGRVWLPTVDPDVRTPNWTDVQEDREEEQEEDDREVVTSEVLQAECRADSAPPSAVDDEFGVRPGRTVILPVLDNDAASACGVLAISTFDEIDEAVGTLVPVHGGRALQLTTRPSASGTVSFTYTVTDGRGATAPSTATVRVTIRTGGNAPPVQLRVGAFVVEQGGTGTYDVLADFRDPDGDPMLLVSAAATGGTARARGDGRLRYQADGGTLGRQTITVVVSDGTEQTEGTVHVDVRPPGAVPPLLEPVHVVTYVDEPATVDALAAVRAHGREAPRLAGVEEVAGLRIETDLDAGTFTVTARAAGTYYVPYTVAAPPQQATGLARIDVLEKPEEIPAPTAVLDVALLPPGGEVTIDPLANDTDPSGGVLVVQSVEVPPDVPLRVSVVGHRLLRISTVRTLEAPVFLTYTASNGERSAVGQVVVQPVPAQAGQQPPVVPDVTATVRTGGVVTIPVLEGAFDPDGDPLTLERTLVEPPAAGLMFVSGDVLRFQAPETPMEVRATFEVSDPMRNRTAATVTIRVHRSDAATKAPPRPRDLTARVYAGEEVEIEIPLVGIDDDGDGVTLLGVDQPPTKGRVVVGSRSLRYEALPGELGTDTFTYAVEDWTGQRAVATIRVGIAPRPTGAAPVVTRDDAVQVRPGQTVEVRVLANDEDTGGGELTLDPELRVQPEGVAARVDGRRVVVEAPRTEGVVQIVYTARNERGGWNDGVLTVTVSASAPFLPPIARDIVVPPAETINATQVAVDVLQTAQNPSGPLSDLAVEVPDSVTTAVARGDGTVLVTLVPEPQTLPYRLVNTHPDAGRVSSYAFITVPALGDFPPMLRPGLDDLTVIAGEPLTIELAERVRVAPGRSPRVGDRSRVSATKSDGPPIVVDEDTLRYVARADYAGPASLTVHVADGPLSDPTVHDATLTFPIMVLAREEHPPTFTPSVLEVPQASSTRVDLAAFTTAPAGADGAARYAYRLAGPAPAGFEVSLVGSVLSVGAPTTTTRGTVGAVPVEIDYGGAEPLAVQVDARVVASREPLARVLDFTVPDGVEGGEHAVRVLEGAFNPFAPEPLQVVGAVVETPGAGTARVAGSSVVINPASGYIGYLVVRYTVRDALADLDRTVEGRITVVVRGRPGQPNPPRVVEVRDRAVALAWDAPAGNGEPIDTYRVTAVGGGVSQDCPATACTITGLTNNVTYRFQVAAHNAVGWSEPSAPSAEARPDTAPLAPAAPTVTRGDRTLTVRWTAPENPGSPILDYLLEVTPATPGGDTSFVVTGTSREISGLANGVVYTVRVRARNSAPEPGAWSPPATGRPARAPDAPAVSATLAGSGERIDVRWTPPADGGEPVEAYEVRVDGAVVLTAGAAETTTSFPAVRGRLYEVEVRARNAVGWSPWGRTQGQIWGQPGSVGPVSVADATGRDTPWGAGAVRAAWSRPTETGGDGIVLRHYRVVLVDSSGGAVRSATVAPAETEVTFVGVPGGTYRVEVTPVNSRDAAGPTSTSPPVTTVTVPATVDEPTLAVGEDRRVTITWRAPANGGAPILRYRLEVRGPTGPPFEVEVPGTSPARTLPQVFPDATVLTVTLTAINADGEAAPRVVELEVPAPPTEGEARP
ncbi:MAG: tandem-95 repeat protein [Actinomycetales bacterium]|nr:tandem-95 repeat protein [Actinomycetales bacterium]